MKELKKMLQPVQTKSQRTTNLHGVKNEFAKTIQFIEQ